MAFDSKKGSLKVCHSIGHYKTKDIIPPALSLVVSNTDVLKYISLKHLVCALSVLKWTLLYHKCY